jgi:flagellar biosynthesis protein FlhG
MSLNLDQAARLRSLMQKSKTVAAHDAIVADNAPHIVTLCSGRENAGVTNICVNLAVNLVGLGQRVVVVDAAMSSHGLTELCNVAARETIHGVLDGRKTVHEVLQPGPGGIQVLPNSSMTNEVPDCSPLAQDRLIRELRRLGKYADIVLLDAGHGMTQVMRRFWEVSDAIINVVVPQTLSVMDGYAMIKLLHSNAPNARIGSLVNCAESEEVASRVQSKIEEVLRRFCQYPVIDWGWFAKDFAVESASKSQQSWYLSNSPSSIAVQLDLLAKKMIAELAIPFDQNQIRIPGVSETVRSMVLAELPMSV